MISPDISALVQRLEAEVYWCNAASESADFPWVAQGAFSKLGELLKEAVQALRALEADRTRIVLAHKAVIFAADEREDALQHQLTHARERLKQCLDVLEDIGPMDWIAKIRKDAGV